MLLQKINKFIITVVIFILSFSAGGCKAEEFVVSRIENYDKFLENFTKYEKDIPKEIDPIEPDEPPEPLQYFELNGLKKSNEKIFDFAMPFKGDYTYVRYGDADYITDKLFNLTESENFQNSEGIYYNKIIFIENGLYGVKSINSDILLSPIYTRIEIIEGTILAVTNDTSYIFTNNKLISSINDTNIMLCDENYIQGNGVFNLDMTEFYYEGYRVRQKYRDNLYIISSPELLIGCIDLTKGIIIEPAFYEILSINENNASVKTEDGHYQLIDFYGNIIFASDRKIPISLYGQYGIFFSNGLYGVIDSNFNTIVEPSFETIYNYCVYGDYLIIKNNRFYSLSEKDYKLGSFEFIIPFDEFFITKNSLGYSLYDKNLNLLIRECTLIDYSDGYVLIVKNEKYYFYTIQN